MGLPWKCVLCFLSIVSAGRAEEATTRQGQLLRGALGKDSFQPLPPAQPLSFDQLRCIRFSEPSPPPVQSWVVHRLLLSGNQAICGELLRVDANEVAFRTARGKTSNLSRAHCRGVVQAGSFLVQSREDFE